MIKIFTRKTKELTTDIDTWIVVWNTYKYKFSDGTHPYVQKCYQAFTNKEEAEEYAEALNKAMTLLQMTALPDAVVKKQEPGGLS
jgi:hypothetical protein